MFELNKTNWERDEKGNLLLPYRCSYSPLFQWPLQPLALLKWLFGWGGFLWPRHIGYAALAVITFLWLQPDIETCATLRYDWVFGLFFRNLALMWLYFGLLHLLLFTLKLHGTERKYTTRWQAVGPKKFLFRNQVFDNIFRSCVSGCLVWTAYEVLYFWAAANGWVPYLSWADNPVWFVLLFLLIPFWREFHFYWIHRFIHWRPLFKTVHKIHHYNPDPAPWSGMSMHVVEHIFYLSAGLIHFILASHPIHFLYNMQLTALTPAGGHQGFEAPLFNGVLPCGDYFHYLHHRYVNCNYGGATIPLDKWFGSFQDGSGIQHKKEEPTTSGGMADSS